MSVSIPFELLSIITPHLDAKSVLCFYLAMCNPECEDTRIALGNIIYRYSAHPHPDYIYIDDRRGVYQDTLTLFCSPWKELYPPNANRPVIHAPNTYSLKVRELLFPIFERLVQAKGINFSYILQASSFELVQEFTRGVLLPSLTYSDVQIKSIFASGNQEIIEYMLRYMIQYKEIKSDIFIRCLGYAAPPARGLDASMIEKNVQTILQQLDKYASIDWKSSVISQHWKNIKSPEFLKILFERMKPHDVRSIRLCFLLSAEVGHLELTERLEDMITCMFDKKEIISIYNKIFNEAAEEGHLSVIRYAERCLEKTNTVVNDGTLINTVRTAMQNGHEELVKYLHQKYRVLDRSVSNCIETFKPDAILKSIHYLFDYCRPVCDEDERKICGMIDSSFLRNLSGRNIKSVYERFRTFINPRGFFAGTAANSRETYQFCRDQLELGQFHPSFCTEFFKKIAIKNDLDLFLYAKEDLSRRIPKFREWWPQIFREVSYGFGLPYVKGPPLILEYYLAHFLTTEEVDDYFHKNNPRTESVYLLRRIYSSGEK